MIPVKATFLPPYFEIQRKLFVNKYINPSSSKLSKYLIGLTLHCSTDSTDNKTLWKNFNEYCLLFFACSLSRDCISRSYVAYLQIHRHYPRITCVCFLTEVVSSYSYDAGLLLSQETNKNMQKMIARYFMIFFSVIYAIILPHRLLILFDNRQQSYRQHNKR